MRRNGATVPKPSDYSRRFRHLAPHAIVLSTVLFNLVTLHTETKSVAYLNDGAIHSEMVRFATQQIRLGHFPLTSWFPLLGEGSPQFLHYQSLGAMLTGGLGVLTGPNVAYAWVLYLLLATWPISVFWAIRLMGFDRFSAAMGALLSPFIVSTLGIGYEQQSYLFIGYGVWSQLLAMWTLPLAWGWSLRALESRKALLIATVFVSATIGLHFLTGYLAIIGIFTAFVCSPTQLRVRVRRLCELLAAVALTSAWVIIPLLRFRTWASINEFLQHGPDVNSYGARQVMKWFVTGQLFDAHRLPIFTALVILGLIIVLVRARHDSRSRNLLLLFTISLLLFFGRTTFGSLFNLLPGSTDIFARRFLMGVQLAGVMTAGIACAELVRWAQIFVGRVRVWAGGTEPASLSLRIAVGALAVGILVTFLAPAWSQIISTDQVEAANVNYQHRADLTQGAEIAPIISLISKNGGRVYAGLPVPSNEVGGWGSSLMVGEVPVFKYLTQFNLDEVGYALRTASLMTDPEVYFDDQNPSDFPLFGVRWLIYPSGKNPTVRASKVMVRGPYVLWKLSSSGYLQLIDTVGSIHADRTNVGARSASYIHSDLAGNARYLTVGFAGMKPATPTLSANQNEPTVIGRITHTDVVLDDGRASASINATRRAVVLLKVSYDPGWHATVDGRPAITQMIAPAYVGVEVPAGIHVVTFTYESGADETLLIGIGLATMIVLIAVTVYLRWSRKSRMARAKLNSNT